MPKIVLLPLDERPCNTIYPNSLFNLGDIQLVLPNESILGNKKTPATFENLRHFLISETKDAYGLVISMDMLLYGGIVPSRLHQYSEEELKSRYQVIEEIKKNNPKITIYAFDLVMRCPQYSSSDEEPDYYQKCGLEIFRSGFIGHKKELGIATEEEKNVLNQISIQQEYLSDFLNRRAVNLKMNLKTIDYVKKEFIDFLIIPQDDAAEYGYTAKDQEKLKESINNYQLNTKIYIYPGADEVANTLISKMITKFKQIKPKFHIQYPATTSGQTIPLLEDKTLDCTVRYQIRAAGGTVVSSISESDIVLFVNAPAIRMMNNAFIGIERNEIEQRKRNLVDFVELMSDTLEIHKKDVAVADVFTLNGSDYELMSLLNQKQLFLNLSAYAGWNTSSNTLGTTIPFAIQSLIFKHQKQLKDFLMSRYVEDFGYMAYVRTVVNQKLKDLGMTYFDISSNLSYVEQTIKEELNLFIEKHLSSICEHIDVEKVWMPWKRMFEVGLKVTYK